MNISVIVPIYNVEAFVGPCLDSILIAAGRTSAKVEVICVDDGSTDGSESILDGYDGKVRASPPNIDFKIVHQPNAGVGAARNRGLELVSGEWILFVDADDFVRETWLEDVLGMIERNPEADLIGFDKLPYFGAGEWGDGPIAERDVGIDKRIDDVLASFCVYQFAYSTRRFGDLRFPSFSVGEDLVFVSAALSRSQRCLVTDRREYGYRYREGSASHAEITPAKTCDVIMFNRMMFSNLEKSRKRIGETFSEGRGREWFFTLARIIDSRRRAVGWNQVWSLWLDSMGDFSRMACFPAKWRRRAAMIARRRTRFVVWLCCLLPAWIERKLVRR